MIDPALSSLIRINHMRIRSLKRQLAPYRYQGTMHLIMLYIRRNPGASQEDIVSFYALDKSSVARDARRLEDMGHLYRETNPENRRQNQLFMTETGQKFMMIMDNIRDDFSEKMTKGLSEEERKTLSELLGRIEENCCREA